MIISHNVYIRYLNFGVVSVVSSVKRYSFNEHSSNEVSMGTIAISVWQVLCFHTSRTSYEVESSNASNNTCADVFNQWVPYQMFISINFQ